LDTTTGWGSSFPIFQFGLPYYFIKSTEKDVGGVGTEREFFDNIDFSIREVLIITVRLHWLDDVKVLLWEVVVDCKLESPFAKLCMQQGSLMLVFALYMVKAKMTYLFTRSLEYFSLFFAITPFLISSLPCVCSNPSEVNIVFVSLRQEVNVIYIQCIDIHIRISPSSNTLAECFNGGHLVRHVVQGVGLLVKIGGPSGETQSRQGQMYVPDHEIG
jgi:hypothetical protein